jgi:hypothetical protein
MASEAVNQVGGQLGDMLGSGFASLGQYKIFFFIILALVVIGVGLYIWSLVRKKKSQWTHKILVQRILPNGQLTKEVSHKCRRFQMDNGTENFELEKMIIGNWIVPRVGDYIDHVTLSLVIDKDNRIYTKKETVFQKDKSCEVISLVHAGIDVTLQNTKAKYQAAHKNSKKITTAELIKAGLIVMLIIGAVVISIVMLGKWSEVHAFKVEQETQQAIAMENLGKAIDSMQGVVNTQQLQLTPMLQALYGKANIAEEIDKYREENEV